MSTYLVQVVGPTGPVSSARIDAQSVAAAAEYGMSMAAEIFDFEVSAALAGIPWRVRVTNEMGVILAELPTRAIRLPL